MKPVLILLRPLDKTAGQRVDVRVADSGSAEDYGVGGNAWDPAISSRPQLSIELFSLDMDGKVQTGRAGFEIDLKRVTSFARPKDLYWRGAAVTIHCDGPLEGPTAVAEFTGYVTSATLDVETGKLSIQAEVSDVLIDKPLLTKKFTGGGGINGDAGKRGAFLPAGFGSVKNIEPVWFDLTRNIGMLDGYDNTLSIDWLGEGLSDFGAPVADYASYAALAAAVDAKAIPPGRWAKCTAKGLVALGAPPVGVITVHAVFGSNRPGALMRRMIETHAAVPTAKVETGAFAQLDADVNRAVHYWTDTQRGVKELLEAIARSCNATPLVNFQGLVTVTRAVASAAVLTLDRRGGTTPRILSWRAGAVEAPFYQVSARAARPARVLTTDEVNFVDTIDDGNGLFDLAATYRAGDRVWFDDGSSFLYINALASAGHVPPAPTRPPATPAADAWWQQLTPPTRPLAGDGTPLEAWAQSTSIYDPMDYASPAEFEKVWISSGLMEVAAVSTSDTGGLAMQFGDGLGNDGGAIVGKLRLPYSPEDLYEVSFDYEILSGAVGTYIYLGVTALDSAGYNMPGDGGSYCYVAAAGQLQSASIGRRMYRGFMRGTAATGAGNSVGAQSPDPAAPATLPLGTAEIAAIALPNYSGGSTLAGRVRIHEVTLRKVVDNTVVATGAWSSSRTYFRNEGVTFGGRSFGSKADGNLNHQPPSTAASDSWWYLIADKGADGATGASGAPGINTATVLIYQRAASAPALPSATTTYDFAAKTLSGLNNGWTATIPAGTSPLYVSAATAANSAGTDAIGSGEWSTPVVLAQNGANGATGANGLNVASVFIYQRASSAPAVPSATVDYTFATGGMVGLNNGWSATIPTTGAGALYVTTATAAGTGAVDSIGTAEWATPTVLATDGGGTFTPINKANMTIKGSSFSKTGGGNFSWDASVHSVEGYAGNVRAAAQVVNATDYVMIGLNSDPNTDASYGSIDCAIYCASGVFYVYLNGNPPGSYGAVASGDVLYVQRRGSILEFGVLGEAAPRYSASIAAFNSYTGLSMTTATKLYFDTAFHVLGSTLAGCSLLPLGDDGSDGAPGAPGVSPIVPDLSVLTMDVAADSNNVTKSGALPKGSVVSLKQGTTLLVPSSINFTYSDGGAGAFAMSAGTLGTATTVSLTTANAPGWVDVNIVYAGVTYTKRIAISRSQDPAPPPSQTSAYTSVSGGSGSGATTYDGSGILGPELVLKANGSGQIVAAFDAEYYTDTPGGSVRSLTVAARAEIAPQSTGVFSAPLSEQVGTQATWDKTDASPGIVSGGGTFTGLTAGAYYRVRVNTRKVSGSNPSVVIVGGNFAVTQ